MNTEKNHSPGWTKRIGWLVLIWLVSVGALGIVAMIFRFMMKSAGLTE